MKVGMDDPSSVEFVERRRAALERQGSVHVSYSDIINEMISNIYTGPVVFFLMFLLCLRQTQTNQTIRSVHKN